MAASKTNGTQLDKADKGTALAQLQRISAIAPDDRKGTVADLAGVEFVIRKVELFPSRAYDTLGVRLFIHRVLGGGEIGPEEMYTSFSAPVRRVAFKLIGEDGVMAAEIDPPVLATVVKQGETYVLA